MVLDKTLMWSLLAQSSRNTEIQAIYY